VKAATAGSFLSDIETLRKRARAHAEDLKSLLATQKTD
jgi:hypothetical protein